jgi:Flp pilus assembly pilin Flp
MSKLSQIKRTKPPYRNERGAGFAEYAFLLALIVLAAIALLEALGLSIQQSFADTTGLFP